MLKPAIWALIEKGIKVVVVTLGSDGVSKFEGSSNRLAVHCPALSASVVRLTRAGDCLVGGTLASLCASLDLMQSLAFGIVAAKAAVEVDTNVSPEYDLAKIADDERTVYFAIVDRRRREVVDLV
ncbi:hypothetical protein F0562_025174 [Nyssa sinensis]|uniref:Carbohydrate kinase PfkB domain-containing protein n=1 Tax=Nyssa sinensis TaxID=561372 RepID=A0A5J5BEV1_9ASTE|nr:hypothetical protein F0562_025174 [Nyssa sinensis]